MYNNNIVTLDRIVSDINNLTNGTPVNASECAADTAEELAAWYAKDAQRSAGYEMSEEAAEAHLQVLIDAGAQFSVSEAMSLAAA